MHEAKLAKMEAEMKLVFQQKVQEKEAKLKQSEEELYARHREMKEALEKQRLDLEDKKRRIESGRPLTPEKSSVRASFHYASVPRPHINSSLADRPEEELLARLSVLSECILSHFGLVCSDSVVLPYLVSYIPPFCCAALPYITDSYDAFDVRNPVRDVFDTRPHSLLLDTTLSCRFVRRTVCSLPTQNLDCSEPHEFRLMTYPILPTLGVAAGARGCMPIILRSK